MVNKTLLQHVKPCATEAIMNKSSYPEKQSVKRIIKNNGRWSSKEKMRFLQALQKYKRNWKAVEQHVKTRTSTQARSHAQKFF
jgi:SHAQKYF class myb-like DNA-binding protein